MALMQVELDDKYRLGARRIYLSGIQALVRLPLLQRQRDRAHNLNTAGFISGYRGLPLGMYGNALWRAKSHLQANDIAFVPGLKTWPRLPATTTAASPPYARGRMI
jgi:indolepyruvate ferredoxin oxidoreductase